MLVHRDEEDPDSLLLAQSVQHVADLVLAVQGLDTGLSKDVHGQLLIEYKKQEAQSPLLLHFKCFDQGVNFFQPGTWDL